jgi:hypothetical protein
MYCPNPDCPDVQESGKAGEYREDIVVCPKCGTALVAEAPPPVPRPGLLGRAAAVSAAVEDEGLVVLAEFNSRQDADLVVSLLAGSGIHATTSADDCGGIDPGLWLVTRTQVLVPEGEEDAARTLLEEAEGGRLITDV